MKRHCKVTEFLGGPFEWGQDSLRKRGPTSNANNPGDIAHTRPGRRRRAVFGWTRLLLVAVCLLLAGERWAEAADPGTEAVEPSIPDQELPELPDEILFRGRQLSVKALPQFTVPGARNREWKLVFRVPSGPVIDTDVVATVESGAPKFHESPGGYILYEAGGLTWGTGTRVRSWQLYLAPVHQPDGSWTRPRLLISNWERGYCEYLVTRKKLPFNFYGHTVTRLPDDGGHPFLVHRVTHSITVGRDRVEVHRKGDVYLCDSGYGPFAPGSKGCFDRHKVDDFLTVYLEDGRVTMRP